MAAFTFPVRVYWEDTDAGGVVYYASYLRFLERARSEWLRSIGVDQVALLRDERRQFVVVEANLKYVRAARHDDRLLVSAVLDQVFGASVVFRQDVCRDGADGELVLSAYIRVACLDSDSLKPKPLPRALVSSIRELQ